MAQEPFFTADFFQFFRDLRENNRKDWFDAHKARYETSVKWPLLSFITAFGPRLAAISPHYVADPRPAGGSMFRIHRDVRFARDKSPYKTHGAAHFRHEQAKNVHAAGFYLHLDPDEVFAGVGVWQPEPKDLGRIRDAIVARPERWRQAKTDKAFAKVFTLEGDTLSRPPKGYDPAHPDIADLKRKDFTAFAKFDPAMACAPDFLDRFAETCAKATPFMSFLNDALDVPFGAEPVKSTKGRSQI